MWILVTVSLRHLSVLFHLFETVVPLSVHLRAVLKCKAGLAAVVLDQAAPHLTAAGTALLIKNPMCMLREAVGLLNRNRLGNDSVQYLIYQILILGVIYYFSLEGTSGPQCRIRVCNLKLFYVILVVLVAIPV